MRQDCSRIERRENLSSWNRGRPDRSGLTGAFTFGMSLATLRPSSILDRDGLMRLLEATRTRAFDVLVMEALDTARRSTWKTWRAFTSAVALKATQ
jgi:hypothetical protein